MVAFALGAIVSQIIIIRRFVENETAKHHHQNKGNKATKTGFGEGVLAAAQKDSRVVGLGADNTTSVLNSP